MLLSRLPAILACLLLLAVSGRAAASIGCGDLLDMLGEHLPAVRYVDCEARPDQQGAPLVARYRLSGRDAAAVERALQRQSDSDIALKRSCCVWELPGAISRVDPASGLTYTLQLHSDETTLERREDWPRIDAFHLLVTVFTEEI